MVTRSRSVKEPNGIREKLAPEGRGAERAFVGPFNNAHAVVENGQTETTEATSQSEQYLVAANGQ